jgi:hypothetical protein
MQINFKRKRERSSSANRNKLERALGKVTTHDRTTRSIFKKSLRKSKLSSNGSLVQFIAPKSLIEDQKIDEINEIDISESSSE